MKKLMSLLGVASLVVVGGSGVVSCASGTHHHTVDPNHELIEATARNATDQIRKSLWAYDVSGGHDNNMNESNLKIGDSDLSAVKAELDAAKDGDAVKSQVFDNNLLDYLSGNIVSAMGKKLYDNTKYRSILFNNINANDILTIDQDTTSISKASFSWDPKVDPDVTNDQFNLKDYIKKIHDPNGLNVKFWYEVNVNLHMNMSIYQDGQVSKRIVIVEWTGYFSNSDGKVDQILDQSYNAVMGSLGRTQNKQSLMMDMLHDDKSPHYSVATDQEEVRSWTKNNIKDTLSKLVDDNGNPLRPIVLGDDDGESPSNYFDPTSLREATDRFYQNVNSDDSVTTNYDFRNLYNKELGDSKSDTEWPNDPTKQAEFSDAMSKDFADGDASFAQALKDFDQIMPGISSDDVFSFSEFDISNWKVDGLVYKAIPFYFFGVRKDAKDGKMISRSAEYKNVSDSMSKIWGPGGALNWQNNYFLKKSNDGLSYRFDMRLSAAHMAKLVDSSQGVNSYFDAAKYFNEEIKDKVSSTLKTSSFYSNFSGKLLDDSKSSLSDFKIDTEHKTTDPGIPSNTAYTYQVKSEANNPYYYNFDGFRFNWESNDKDKGALLLYVRLAAKS